MIALLVIKTNQLEKLKSFYELLEMDFKMEQHGTGPIHYSTLIKKQDIVFEIYPLSQPQSSPDTSTRLGFKVNDLEKTIKAIVEVGGIVQRKITKTDFGILAVVKDFDGRRIEVYQRE